MEPLVALTRSNFIESLHRGYICVTASNKKIIFNTENTETRIFLRSTAKPFQAIALIESGALEKFNLNLEEIAIMCASHSGQDFHLDVVKSILKKIGLDENYLSCGAAKPYNLNISNELIRKAEKPSQLHNGCSGKHAGILALCRYYGFSVEDYCKPEHPVQKLIIKTLADLLEININDIETGLDGCGIPTFITTINQAAYLYSLLAQGSNGTNRYKDSLGIIQKAMASYPRMISGDNEFCTDLIYHSKGETIGKVGAEGIYCVAVPAKQIGICIKISDGNERGLYPATIHILRQLGYLSDEAYKKLKYWAYPLLKNHKGEITGYSVPVFDIHKEADLKNIQIGNRYEIDLPKC